MLCVRLSRNFQLTIINENIRPARPHENSYGTAKILKLADRDGVDKLPIRPIISRLNTATDHIAKYLANYYHR